MDAWTAKKKKKKKSFGQTHFKIEEVHQNDAIVVCAPHVEKEKKNQKTKKN